MKRKRSILNTYYHRRRMRPVVKAVKRWRKHVVRRRRTRGLRLYNRLSSGPQSLVRKYAPVRKIAASIIQRAFRKHMRRVRRPLPFLRRSY